MKVQVFRLSTNARWNRYATANTPQSLPFFCCWMLGMFIVIEQSFAAVAGYKRRNCCLKSSDIQLCRLLYSFTSPSKLQLVTQCFDCSEWWIWIDPWAIGVKGFLLESARVVLFSPVFSGKSLRTRPMAARMCRSVSQSPVVSLSRQLSLRSKDFTHHVSSWSLSESSDELTWMDSFPALFSFVDTV